MARKTVQSGSLKPLGIKSKEVSWSRGRRMITRTKVYANKRTGEVFESSKTSTFNFGGLLSLLAICLLAASLFSYFTGASQKSFYSFLVMLQEVPEVIPLDKLLQFFSFDNFILNLPSWAEFLSPVLEFLSSVCTLFAFIVKGAISAFSFLFYFVRWLFI